MRNTMPKNRRSNLSFSQRRNRSFRPLLETLESRLALATVFGVTDANELIQFDSATPSTIITSTPITGQVAGETVVGIDYRPATGQLFALSSGSRLYTIAPGTGVATQVGASGAFSLSGTSFGFDFNPTVDRIRVVSDTDQNLRLNPNNGALAATDLALVYDNTTADGDPIDPNAGQNPSDVHVAYTNNFAGATTTTLYGIDTNLDILVTQIPPNNGVLNTVGSLGINVTNNAGGFDILTQSPTSPVNTAFAALSTNGTSSAFYTINLTTGAATLVGNVGVAPTLLRGIAVVPEITSPVMLATDTANNLIRFNSASPGTIITQTPITGLVAGDTIQGIDFRPATGELYGLGSGSRLYKINPSTAVATQVGANGAFAIAGNLFGFDFNPVPDRIRLTSTAAQNLRLNPNDGTLTATDGVLAYDNTTADGDPIDPNAGTSPSIVASAYTNSFAGTAGTTLYDLDFGLDILAIQNPPNNGVLNTVGPLGVNFSNAHFDIQPLAGGNNAAFAALLTAGPGYELYTINLTTGAATLVGPIGAAPGPVLTGLAVLPPPARGVTASLSGNQLIVVGTVLNDSIVIDQLGAPGAEVRVLDNGNVAFTFPSAAVNLAYVTAREGNDSITIAPSFGARPTILQGDAGSDAFEAGAGNDRVLADAADTTAATPRILGGGGGFDYLILTNETAGITFNNNTATTGGFEHIFGGSGNDTITNAGSTTGVVLVGFGGNDTLTGGDGNDYIDGVDGDDTQTGNGGDDTLVGTNFTGAGSGIDKMTGGGGNDTLLADLPDISAATPVLLGGEGPSIGAAFGTGDTLNLESITGTSLTFNDNMAAGLTTGIGGFEIIKSGGGNDTITVTNATDLDGVYVIGGGGDDLLTGGLAPDALQGGAGNDRLIGLQGGDAFVGNEGTDTVDYSVSPAPPAPVPGFAGINGVVVDLRQGQGSAGSSGGHAQGDTYIGDDVEVVIGTANNDYIIGNGLNNLLDGLAGDDTILGNQGNDELIGGTGNDTLIGSDGVVFTDIDKLDGGEGNDLIYADAADLTGGSVKVTGGSGSADVLDFLFSGGVTFLNDFTAGAATGGFEQILGSGGNDTITTAGPGALPNLYYVGRGGNDVLSGANGNDALDGGDGNDTLTGGLGADTFIGGAGTDTATDFNAGQGDTSFGIP